MSVLRIPIAEVYRCKPENRMTFALEEDEGTYLVDLQYGDGSCGGSYQHHVSIKQGDYIEMGQHGLLKNGVYHFMHNLQGMSMDHFTVARLTGPRGYTEEQIERLKIFGEIG